MNIGWKGKLKSSEALVNFGGSRLEAFNLASEISFSPAGLLFLAHVLMLSCSVLY